MFLTGPLGRKGKYAPTEREVQVKNNILHNLDQLFFRTRNLVGSFVSIARREIPKSEQEGGLKVVCCEERYNIEQLL
jgi:hypothetical protein